MYVCLSFTNRLTNMILLLGKLSFQTDISLLFRSVRSNPFKKINYAKKKLFKDLLI